jgi:hypothetical protein
MRETGTVRQNVKTEAFSAYPQPDLSGELAELGVRGHKKGVRPKILAIKLFG